MSVEAMKLALEALNQIKNANIKGLYLLPDFHNAITSLHQAIKDEEESFRPDYDTNAVLLERIRELEAQLGQAENQEPVGAVLNVQWMSNTGGWEIGFHSKRKLFKGEALYTAPQEQGCAECGKKASDGWALYCVKCSEPLPEQEPVAWMQANQPELYVEECKDDVRGYTIPLYTAPPSKPWVPLSAEEIKNLYSDADPIDMYLTDDATRLARAIEAKLKELNND